MPRGLHRDGYSWKPRSASRLRPVPLGGSLSVVRKARHPDLYALSRWRASPSVFSPLQTYVGPSNVTLKGQWDQGVPRLNFEPATR